MKSIRESAPFRRVGAYLILGPETRGYVATIYVLRPERGDRSLRVEIRQAEVAALACIRAHPHEPGTVPDDRTRFRAQHGVATGMGYNKLFAALDGLWVDGFELRNDGGDPLTVLRRAGYTIHEVL